jgi:hypothetical protein
MKNVLTENRTQDPFQGGLSSCKIKAETNNFGLGAVLLSRFDSELKKLSSPGLEPMSFSGLWPLFL